MRYGTIVRLGTGMLRKVLLGAFVLAAGLASTVSNAVAQEPPDSAPPPPAFEWDPNDPRIGLASGWLDAESAIRGRNKNHCNTQDTKCDLDDCNRSLEYSGTVYRLKSKH